MKFNVTLVLYYFFLKEFVAYVVANQANLNVSDTQKTTLEGMWTNYQGFMNAYTNPTTYGPGSESNIHGAYNTDSIYTGRIQGQIKSNPAITLTGTARLALDIPEDKPHRTHVPVSDIRPSVTFLSKTPLTIKIFVFNPANPTKKGKEKDVAAVGYRIAITDADAAAPALSAYELQLPKKKTVFDTFYTSDQVGKRVWIIAFYLNPTGEAGPDGEPFSTLIA